MEPGISYDCAFNWIISFYETYHLFSASMVRYEFPRIHLIPGFLKGITMNAPVLIASAVFLNKVSWAAIILAAGGLAYVNSSCFEMTLLTSGLCIQLDYVVRYVKKNRLWNYILNIILIRYNICMPRQERRCNCRRKIHHTYPSKQC